MDFAVVHSQEWLCHGTFSRQQKCRRGQMVTLKTPVSCPEICELRKTAGALEIHQYDDLR